jgi:transposase
MDKYIGLDVDHKNTVACIIENGRPERYATMATDVEVIRHWLLNERARGEGKIHLTFEVSGIAGNLYDNLVSCVDSLVVNNPSKNTWVYRTAKKTDREDAKKQAILYSIGQLHKVHMPSKQVRQWRQVLQHRRVLINNRSAVKNQIKALLKSQGFMKAAAGGSWWKKANIAWMRAQTCGPDLWRFMLAQLLERLSMIDLQVKSVTKYLDDKGKGHAGVNLLMSIPGVGPRTAEAVIAYADDISRFGRGKGFGCYFGLTPKLDESGQCRRLGHISKEGPGVVRWLICESAWRAVKKSAALRGYFERAASGKKDRKKKAIVGVARKLLLIMRAMLRTGELYNESLVGGICAA